MYFSIPAVRQRMTVYNSLYYDVDYPTLKEALLTHFKFGVTVMGSKLHFRRSKFNGHDNAQEHVNKLQPLLRRWLIPLPEANMSNANYIHLCHQVVENELIMEQFCNGMPTELQKYLDARNPTMVEAMCQYIESYQLQHSKNATSERRAMSYSTQQYCPYPCGYIYTRQPSSRSVEDSRAKQGCHLLQMQ